MLSLGSAALRSVSAAFSYAPTAVSSQPDRHDLSAIHGDVEVVLFDFDGTLTKTPGVHAGSHRTKVDELRERTPMLEPWLQRLHEAGFVLGIISKSTKDTVVTALEETGLLKLMNGPIIGKAVGLEGKAGIIKDLCAEGGALAHLGLEGWHKVLLVDDDTSELIRARDVDMQIYAAPAQGGLQENDLEDIFRCLGLGARRERSSTPLAQPRWCRTRPPPVRLEDFEFENEEVRSLWTQGLVGQCLGLCTEWPQKRYCEGELAPKLADFFDVTEELGQGSYGTAYIGVHRSTSSKCAVKVLGREHVGQHYHDSFVERDTTSLLLRMARESPHPNVVGLLDMLMSDLHFFVVMDLLEGPDLFEYLRHHAPLTEEFAKLVMRNSLSALAHIHSVFGVGLIHRDVKPENLRFRDSGPNSELVLVDFGLCCPACPHEENRMVVGTLLYVAPEVFSKIYSTQVDLWSLGVVLYIVLTGQLPFKLNLSSGFVLEKRILSGEAVDTALRASELSTAPAGAVELLRALLVVDPCARMNAEEGLRCAWLDERPHDQSASARKVFLVGSSLSFCSASKYSSRTPKKVGQLENNFNLDIIPIALNFTSEDADSSLECTTQVTDLQPTTSSATTAWVHSLASYAAEICK
eukprot:TRINITY_DN10666_c0_g1_i1.p1 TRINITY_DN10666_c0_g1~~TRINITY_DN10666_c0_g1_i1.p1  ORF type:complete len:636 (-),score=127.92 TRINITY_DN10666_c0_g1_i1:20-1927(-)